MKKIYRSLFILAIASMIANGKALAADAPSYKGKGSFLASISFHTPDPRIGNIKGFCRNLDTGEEVICIHRYIGAMRAYGTRTDSSNKIGWVYSRTSDLKALNKGRYQLEVVKFAIAKYHTGARYGEYDYEISTKEFGIFFDVTEKFQYIGNIVFDVDYDSRYKPFFENVRVEDNFELSKSVLRKSAQRKVEKRASKAGGVTAVARANKNNLDESHIRAMQWTPFSSLESKQECLNGGRFEDGYLYINRRANGGPLVGLHRFSCVFQSVLKEAMSRENVTEFKEVPPFRSQKKHYKVKIDLR